MSDDLPTILCVDDEPEVLKGLSLDLSWDFEVLTAEGGAEGLEILANTPVSAIISDMRMPGMDGAEFLSRARKLVPDVTRILLTGHADLNASIRAVNEGSIFRFLTKPCSSRDLTAVLESAVEQHRLITAEKVLLEQTLRGAVSSLRATLSLVQPDVFGFADLVRRRAAGLIAGIPTGDVPQWAVDVALDLCLMPLITLAPDTIDVFLSGRLLFGHHKEAYDKLPQSVGRLLGTIPRLDEVCHILAHQYGAYKHRSTEIHIASHALRLATDFELLVRNESASEAWSTIRAREGWYHPDLLPRLAKTIKQDAEQSVVELTKYEQLLVSHVLAKPVLTADGMTLVPQGTEITAPLKERLSNFASRGALVLPLYVVGR